MSWGHFCTILKFLPMYLKDLYKAQVRLRVVSLYLHASKFLPSVLFFFSTLSNCVYLSLPMFHMMQIWIKNSQSDRKVSRLRLFLSGYMWIADMESLRIRCLTHTFSNIIYSLSISKVEDINHAYSKPILSFLLTFLLFQIHMILYNSLKLWMTLITWTCHFWRLSWSLIEVEIARETISPSHWKWDRL